ncbi:MAG: flavodoxin family protein [Clostridia bacterium]|jgi:multimeric flavodoxin WrbA|nr:flavodoxin family protein [Clostridia bacterium]
MKILSIQGSPRKNKNTSALLSEYLRGAQQNADVYNETVYLQPMDIKPCTGCDACKTTLDTCIIEDEMLPLYDKVKTADVLVFATPIYWWHMSAQLKTFLDRMYALDFETGFPGKRFVLLMTYGGEDPNTGAQILEKSMQEIMEYLQMQIACIYGVCTGTTPMKDNPKALDKAYELGKQLSL